MALTFSKFWLCCTVRKAQRRFSLALLAVVTKHQQPGLVRSHCALVALPAPHFCSPSCDAEAEEPQHNSHTQAVPLCPQNCSRAEEIRRDTEIWLLWPRKEGISNSIPVELCSRNSAKFQICSFSEHATFLGCFWLCLISLDTVSSSVL